MGWRFLLFDLDNTLLDFPADEEMAFRKLYAWAGFEKVRPYTPEALEHYERCNRRWWDRFEKGECTKPELFVGRFVDYLAETGLQGDPQELHRQFFTNLAAGGVALAGALELLERLSPSFKLYVVTNGNAPTAKTRIANSGVGRFIKGYFVSEAIGVGKPDPRYFQYVFEHIPGFRKEEAVLIGDSLFSDIAGAKTVGLESIYLPPPWEEAVFPNQADYTVGSFDELEALLAKHAAATDR